MHRVLQRFDVKSLPREWRGMSDKFCLSPFKVTESGTDYICPLGLIGGQDSAAHVKELS